MDTAPDDVISWFVGFTRFLPQRLSTSPISPAEKSSCDTTETGRDLLLLRVAYRQVNVWGL